MSDIKSDGNSWGRYGLPGLIIAALLGIQVMLMRDSKEMTQRTIAALENNSRGFSEMSVTLKNLQLVIGDISRSKQR